MKTFIFVYLMFVLVNVLITAVAYIKNPKHIEGCDFGLFKNLVVFFLWPVAWIVATVRVVYRKRISERHGS